MTAPLHAQSGFSAWRLIAEELRREIADGGRVPGSRLPTEAELAERFDVHRNTVRQAVGALAAEGLVVPRRGSGTFVAEHSLIVHRIGVRTRLSQSLGPQGGRAPGILLEAVVETDPPPAVDERLRLEGRPALRMESVRTVDGGAISRGTHWFDAERVDGIDAVFARTGSITQSLAEVGIPDYVRVSTVVGARIASVDETHEMQIPQGTVVLAVRALDALPDGTPLQEGFTRFRADRVELDVEHPGGS